MKYEAVIGLEVHAELSTESKIFCSCSAKFGAGINTHTCPVCTGMPGSLPVLNRQVVHYAAKMGLATGCTVNRLCKSDRKNYFYPDLPKAYQISQFDVPICENGEVYFYVDGEKKCCRLERIHFEEDAGKLLHDEIDGTVVDFNRCGVPLIEMVTRPDLHSSAEAKEFLETIKTTLSYLDICDCKMEEGSIRCDVNVSIRPEGSTELGTRVEMKNINTFSGAVRAIDFEVARQIDVVEHGGTIQQETRRWDDVKLKNTVMRTKEDAQDYRYFPDPDLIAVEIDDAWMDKIRSEIPELPVARYERYRNEFGMTAMEARQLSDSFAKAELLDAAARSGKVKPKAAANWILSDISKYLNDKAVELEGTKMTADKLIDLIVLIDKGTISGAAGKKVLPAMFETDETVEAIVGRMGLKQVSDEGAILKIVQDVLADNQKAIDDYKVGKNVTGFLVGQCMKASKGQGNPQMINKLLAQELAKLG
ncbi:Asp-tRNA(Asn)/Glu-tRNA(Gln) amidotransferase subunit GatB [Intestinibacillus massiliensis]|nr:Asp-tRNA(Asn)/Glu-tRNA(Gln) amidotransferase subunit GatB [Intestinibacillus massiliensis]